MPFHDRQDAGNRLAEHLTQYKGKATVVLALPRGGVAVALPIALWLEAPLELLLVRKIGVPGYPEVAMGAIIDGSEPAVVRNEEVLEKALQQDPALAASIEEDLALQLQWAHEARRGMDGRPPVERLLHFRLRLLERPLQPAGNVTSLRRHPIVMLPISRADQANYFGISQARLAEAIEMLERCMLIRQATARHFEILDETGTARPFSHAG